MASSALQRPLKVRDTSGFLPSELLQVADIVHAVRDAQCFPPASVSPALTFMASLGHASMHEDAVSSPLLRPDACLSLQGDVQSRDPMLVSPLICFTPLPLSAFLHTWRDLPGVSPWILRTIQFGCTLQFAPGHPDPQLPGLLARFSQFQGAGDSSQGLSPSPPSRAWPPAEWPEERAHSSPADHIFGGLSGLNLDAGLSGPCSGGKHPIVLGLLLARPSHVSGPVSQAPRPHGSSFPGYSLGAAPYETIPLVDEVPGYSPLLAVPPPTKSVRRLSPRPLSVAGPQFSLDRSEYGGSLPSPNDNDGCFPLGVGGGLRGKAGLQCLVRQVPSLAHKWPGVESGSSSSHSFSSIPGALSCHRQDGQRGGGVSHQSPGGLPIVRPEQACVPASSLGTGQIFVPESGPCPRGPEPSGELSVETETQVGGMDAEPPDGGSDLGTIWRGRGGPLCVSGVDPVPPLVLPLSPYLFGDRCTSAPLAGHESVCFPSGQAHPSGIVQGEDIRSPFSSSPVLAFLDVVLRVGLPSGGRSVGDSNQERPAVPTSGQNLAPTSRDLEVVGMADHRSPLAFDLSDGVRETINSARALSTRKLYSSKWRVFESWFSE